MSKIEELVVIVVCLLMDVLVLPAILMIMWNHCIIKNLIVAPGVLPDISYGTAIVAHMFVSCVQFSMSRTTMGFDKEKNMTEHINRIYGVLESMHMHNIHGNNSGNVGNFGNFGNSKHRNSNQLPV